MPIGAKAAKETIYVRQGSDWSASFQIKDAAGVVVPLAGSSFAGQIRKTKGSGTIVASFVFEITGDTVKYTIPRAVSSAMTAGDSEADEASKYVYDIEWTKPSNEVERIQEGVLILSREVTR